MEKTKKLQKLFKENQGVLTSQKLQSFGFNQYLIKKLIKQGIIERIRRGTYIHSEYEEDEYFLVQQIIPKGIICLLSAASIYNYTTYIPNSYHLAIKSNYYPTLPEYPPITLYYWRPTQYKLGIIKKSINELPLKIYDKEKTVCDFLKFRKKLETTVVNQVIKSYLKDGERDLIKLKRYSKELKIESILNNYLEILL